MVLHGLYGVVRLLDVLFVPQLASHLLSISAAARRGVQTHFDSMAGAVTFLSPMAL